MADARLDARSADARSGQDEDVTRLRDLPFGGKLIVTVALIALALHLSAVTLDATALFLIALALSPWFPVLIEKVKFGEAEFTLRARQRRQQDYIDSAIRVLLTTVASEWELKHLERFANPRPFPATLSGSFEKELLRLIEAGLIRRKPGRGIRTLGRAEPSNDAKDHFEITEAGEHFLEIRRRLVEEGKASPGKEP